jgi:large subunit ribosomal protein L21
MYAVIRSGGKQYKVQEGDVIRVEKLDAKEGDTVTLGDVLLIADGENVKVGTPLIKGAAVNATVKSQGKGEKVRSIKKRRRKHYRKTIGHRQTYTELAIAGIKAK